MRIIKSFTFALNGIVSLLKNEPNARIHLLALFMVVIAGKLFELSGLEWILVAIVAGLVFMAELLNTAIEKLADRVSPEHDINVGQVKDYAAGAVLVAAIIALIAGALLFIPKVISLFKASQPA